MDDNGKEKVLWKTLTKILGKPERSCHCATIYQWSSLTYESVDKYPSHPVTMIRIFSLFLINSNHQRPRFLRSLLEGGRGGHFEHCFCRLRILSTFLWLTMSCVWCQMLIGNSHAILALSKRDKNILNTSFWPTLSCVWYQMLICNSHAILALSGGDKNILNTSLKSESYS